MHDITCPHCHKAFKIDESGYADIVKQIRDSEFEQQLHERLALAEENKRSALELARAKAANELQTAAADKDREIQQLKATLENAEIKQRLAVTEALAALERERDALKNDVDRAQLERQLEERRLREIYEVQIQDRDAAIERLRDMKARLSTKMVGETLEQHCEIEFARIRATAFPNAYFEKDNDVNRPGFQGGWLV